MEEITRIGWKEDRKMQGEENATIVSYTSHVLPPALVTLLSYLSGPYFSYPACFHFQSHLSFHFSTFQYFTALLLKLESS